MHLDTDGHARVSAAVRAAEAGTSGEIVTIVAERSDPYHDAAIQYAVLVAFLALGAYALFPDFFLRLAERVTGGWWIEPSPKQVLGIVWIAVALKYLAARLILAWMPLRLALVPKTTRRRRVRRRAVALFKVGAEARTTGRTGILIYLSLGERMAEIVADEAIHARVPEEAWGDAMAALVAEVREGRLADGLIAAVGQVGTLLAAQLPRAADDANELPDRVVEL